ncbi:Cilia- and flagella-associated protein 99 [Desmophyllum pertusum]|uniref:Cilia- and flagella-associated protein 99 n=1 Tax=Desmophyllum pertusum TaxID=174260 RepID=A0A9W9YW01_9CNID|nr:Cilia- and flagella-associated protein 99 [Desmophyllum pertusum]
MDHKRLLSCCVEILDSFNPRIHGVLEHLNTCLATKLDLEESDESFITEVFSGCVQYTNILKVVVDAFFADIGKTSLRVDRNVYTVVVYLALYRLDELGIAHYRKFVVSHEANKMYKFLSFLFNEDNITTWMKHEVSRHSNHLSDGVKHYEHSYVQTNLISPLLRWLPELHDLVAELGDKLANKQKPRKPKAATEPKPFNLTKPRPRSVPMPEKIPKLKKLRQVPQSTYRAPVEDDVIAKIREENRKRAEEELIRSSARQPSCASAEKSDKAKRRMRRIINEENSKLQFNKVKAQEMPSTTSGNIPIKLNAATILREGILFQKKEEEELKKLLEYEKGGRDATEFLKWQENTRKKDLEERLAEIEMRRLEGKLSYEEAILARQTMIRENQQRVIEMKEETRDMMQKHLERKSKEGEEMRKLVEQTMSEHENTKEARKKLQEYKQKLVQEVSKESQELMRKALEEAEEEMRQRVALIAKIRAIESVPVIRFKHVDLTESSGAGLLSEMSVSELRERLALLKIAEKEDVEDRRDNILKSKVEKDQFLMDTLETIAKHRAEKGNEAAIQFETKKRQKKPEVKDPKLQELQERLEARKAERKKESEKLAVVPKKSSARRQKVLQAEKAALEKMRWRELEQTREKAAKLRGEGLASRNSAGVRPVTTLRNQQPTTKIAS